MKNLILVTALLAATASADLLITLKDGSQAKIVGDLAKLEIVAATPPPPVVTPSADKTTIPAATQIIDAGLNVWTLNAGVVQIGGKPAGVSANVTLLLYYSGTIYQQNNAGGWWKWVNSAWVDTTDPRVVTPPPTTGVTQGSWQSGDLAFAGLHSGKPFHYDYLLPANYDKTKKYPILVYEHENTEGNTWYQGGGSIWNQYEIDGAFNSIAFRTAYPAIIVVPYCDQTDGTGGTGENFGGYSDTPGSQANERAVVALVQYFQQNFSIDSSRIYATGDSLGGIGTAALMLDYNTVNGPKGQIFAAGLPYASQIVRSGELSQATITRMHDVPMFAVSGSGDTTSPIEAFVRPLWRGLAGNSNYPGPQGAQAGTSKFRYLEDTALNHDVWHTYRQLPGGKPMYDWLFAQIAGSVTPPPVKQTPSADKTIIPPATQIVDASANVWTINSGVVQINGAAAGISANVTLLLYYGGVIYQQNQAGGIWSWTNNAWSASGDPRTVTPPPVTGSGFTTSGRNIIDPTGKPIRLLSTAYWMNNPDVDMPKIKAAGFNALRYAWTNRNLSLGDMDKVVSAATKSGLLVVFDNHANEGISSPCWAQQANGLWYDQGGATDGTDGCGIQGTVSQAKFQSDWVSVAQHFKGNLTVLGYDLRNEPLHYANQSTWGDGDVNHDIRLMYQTVGNAILDADPTKLIICEGPQQYNGTFTDPNGHAPWGDLSNVRKFPVSLKIANKVVYSVHDYGHEIAGFQPDSGSGKTSLQDPVFGYIAKENIAPLYIGEWTAQGTNQPYIDTFVSYANSLGASTSYWMWGHDDSGQPTGILNGDGSLDQNQMNQVLRLNVVTASVSAMKMKVQVKAVVAKNLKKLTAKRLPGQKILKEK